MDLKITTENGKMRATVTGRLDTTNSDVFEKKMAPLLEGGNPDIEIDCSELEYISSSGLRLFLTLQKSVNARGGKLVILIYHIYNYIRRVIFIFFKQRHAFAFLSYGKRII